MIYCYAATLIFNKLNGTSRNFQTPYKIKTLKSPTPLSLILQSREPQQF